MLFRHQAKMVQSAKAKGGQEIPVPRVSLVPTYKLDYLPTFREQNTYIRGRGARACPAYHAAWHACHTSPNDAVPCMQPNAHVVVTLHSRASDALCSKMREQAMITRHVLCMAEQRSTTSPGETSGAKSEVRRGLRR